ncbi:hypothetical protein QBC39DRAFT_433788 [Podospora conica]|nr:hypothetical protein QBC39DRAFT_433788 [Schizothecium conicum]
MAPSLKHFILAAAYTTIATAQNPNSAVTCSRPIRSLYAAHPPCAQSCLGCDASNETFEHNCELNTQCCGGSIARAVVPLVYACVREACASEADAQASWEEFLGNCARHGTVVDEADTPPGGDRFAADKDGDNTHGEDGACRDAGYDRGGDVSPACDSDGEWR